MIRRNVKVRIVNTKTTQKKKEDRGQNNQGLEELRKTRKYFEEQKQLE